MGSSEGGEEGYVCKVLIRNQSLPRSCESAREGSVGTSKAGTVHSQAELHLLSVRNL